MPTSSSKPFPTLKPMPALLKTPRPTPNVEGGLSRHPSSDVHAGLLKGLGIFKKD